MLIVNKKEKRKKKNQVFVTKMKKKKKTSVLMHLDSLSYLLPSYANHKLVLISENQVLLTGNGHQCPSVGARV